MKPKTVVTIQYFRVPSEKSIRPSAIRGRAARIWAMRPLNPAASKTRKNTSAAIRASSPSPLVTDAERCSAPLPRRLARSTWDTAFRSTSDAQPEAGQPPQQVVVELGELVAVVRGNVVASRVSDQTTEPRTTMINR